MKTLFIFFAFTLWLSGATIEPPRQYGQLLCQRVLTLSDVFDSGFRPYRVTQDDCSVGKADIRLTLPTASQAVSVGADLVSFGVNKHDAVARIDIRTNAVPVVQAGTILKQLAQSLNTVPQGLDEALARAKPENPKWSDVWTQDWANDWAKVHLVLQPMTYFLDDASKGYREMKALVHLTIEWKPTEIGPTYREKPITPPKGYEHISMDMPSSDLVKKAQASDDPSLAHLRYPDESQRKAILATTPDPVPKPKTKPPLAQKKASESQPTTPREEPASSTPWSIIVVSIVAACGVLWLLLKRRS